MRRQDGTHFLVQFRHAGVFQRLLLGFSILGLFRVGWTGMDDRDRNFSNRLAHHRGRLGGRSRFWRGNRSWLRRNSRFWRGNRSWFRSGNRFWSRSGNRSGFRGRFWGGLGSRRSLGPGRAFWSGAWFRSGFRRGRFGFANRRGRFWSRRGGGRGRDRLPALPAAKKQPPKKAEKSPFSFWSRGGAWGWSDRLDRFRTANDDLFLRLRPGGLCRGGRGLAGADGNLGQCGGGAKRQNEKDLFHGKE